MKLAEANEVIGADQQRQIEEQHSLIGSLRLELELAATKVVDVDHPELEGLQTQLHKEKLWSKQVWEFSCK